MTGEDSPEREQARVGPVGPLPLGFGNPGIITVPVPQHVPSNIGTVGGQPVGSRNRRIVMAPHFPHREPSRNLGVVGGQPVVPIPEIIMAPHFPHGEHDIVRNQSGAGDIPSLIVVVPAPVNPPQVVQKNIPKVQKEVQEVVADYVQALNQAKTARSNVDRARGWYRAAALAGDFKTGQEIMGYEGAGGAGGSDFLADDPLVTAGERQRFKASVAQPDFRYHYRFVAVDEAVHAADLLPPRSQAFAAVLCHATGWMINRTSCPVSASDLRASPVKYGSKPLDADYDFEREALTCGMYQRYLKEGTVLPWATHFGRHCPEPDFVSVVNFAQTQASRDARHHSQMVRHRWIVLMKLVLVALCLGASTWWFWRHRYV